MDQSARRNLSGILVAAATAFGGVALLLTLSPLVDDNAPTLLLVLVLLAASWYGAWPTFVATLLCLIADAWFFLEPQHSLLVAGTGDRLRLLVFALIGILLGIFGEIRLRYLLRSELRLRASEARKAAMISTALDAIVTIDHHGLVVEFNQAAEEIFGWRQEEVRGRDLAELVIPPEMRERHRQGLARRLRTGQGSFLNRHLEMTALHRDGRRFPIELSITLIDTVEPPLFTGFIRDITIRKQAEQALRQSEELFRALAENIAAFAWMADPAGRIFWFNQRWFDYTGMDPEKLGDEELSKVVHPEHLRRVGRRFRHCMRSGEPWEDTFPIRGRDGEYRWFLSRAQPIRDPDGRIERWFGTDTDITAERELQEELSRSAARLAEADRRKDEFLATLAHELRNPLAPIRTGLSVMKMAKGEPAVLDNVRNILERQTEQLITLVDDLMDVSRITRGKLELRKKHVLLSAIVESAVEAARPLMDGAGHRLAVSLPEQEVEIYCDPHRMAQVLSNLLNNAARYTPDGGHISLLARVDDKEAVIAVRDTGIGIPPAKLEQIFEMFTQIASPMDGARGLGIGLTLARSLMEMHGGSIEVYSEGENLGSEFIVRLPLASPAASRGPDLLAEVK